MPACAISWNRGGPFAFFCCDEAVLRCGTSKPWGLSPRHAVARGQVAAGQQAAGVLELAVKRTTVSLLEFIRRPEWLRAL
jgi:hypothetical protein